MQEVTQRILIVLVAGIGDFVMATPAIRSVAHGFPKAEITLLTTPQAVDLGKACPYLHRTYVFDLRAYRPGERGMGWRSWWNFREVTQDLRKQRFSLAVDLYWVATWMGAIRMMLLLSGVRARRTAGRWSNGRGIIFGLRSRDCPHEMDAMLALAQALGCPPEDPFPELWIPEAARESATARLSAVGISPPTPYAVLNLGSNRPEARLPLDKAAHIVRLIRSRVGYPILLTGDAAETPLAESVVAQVGQGAESVAGNTTLLELAAILAGARLVVTTDSGPMHMAAAVRTPLVVLFGPAAPERTGPRSQPGRIVILQGHAHPRDPGRWHADITPHEVVEASLGLLSASPSVGRT